MPKNKMTMQEAIQRVLQAVEYYDMVHDTGDEKQNKENKDYAWKGYDRLVEILHEENQTQRLNTLFPAGPQHTAGQLPGQL